MIGTVQLFFVTQCCFERRHEISKVISAPGGPVRGENCQKRNGAGLFPLFWGARGLGGARRAPDGPRVLTSTKWGKSGISQAPQNAARTSRRAPGRLWGVPGSPPGPWGPNGSEKILATQQLGLAEIDSAAGIQFTTSLLVGWFDGF